MRSMRTWLDPSYRGERLVGNPVIRRYTDAKGKKRVEHQAVDQLIPAGVVELRVHGVNGGTPEQNLHDPSPVRVSGDDTAGFYRRRRELASGPDRTVEAYNWSAINSKKSIRSWWLMLFPFAAANFAGWLLPAGMDDKPKRRVAGQRLVRLIGLCVTILAVLGGALVFVDLIGVQCGSVDSCKTGFAWGWVGSIANWGILDDRPVRLAMAYSLVPAMGILALWLLGRRSRAYEEYGAGQPNQAMDDWDKPLGDTIDDVRMDKVEFWQAPDVVYVQAWLHGTAGLSALTAVMAFAVRELADKAQHHDSLRLLGVLSLVLLGLTAVAEVGVSQMRQIPRSWLRKKDLAFYRPRSSWGPAGSAILLYGLTFWAGWLTVGGVGADQAPLEAIRNGLIWATLSAVLMVFTLAIVVGAHRSTIFASVSGLALFYFVAQTGGEMRFRWFTGTHWLFIELIGAVVLILVYRFRSLPMEQRPDPTRYATNPVWIFGTTALIIVAGAASFVRIDSSWLKAVTVIIPLLYLVGQFATQIRHGHDYPAKEQMREGPAAVVAGLAVASALTAASSSALFVAGRLGETQALPRYTAAGESDICLSTAICYPAEIGWFALAAVAGFLVVFVTVVMRLLLLEGVRWRSKLEDICQEFDDQQVPDGAYDNTAICTHPRYTKDRLHFAKRGLNARWYANVTDDADWIIAAAVMATLTLLVTAATARLEKTLPTVDMNAAFDAASWAVALVVVAVGSLMYAARGNKQLRATMGILWDVMSFFPRRFHPLAPPCYAERAVIDVRNRLIYMTTRGSALTKMADSDVILVAHSEGSLIATAALLSLLPRNATGGPVITRHPGHPKPTGTELKHVAFVTYGCMLARLYGRAWPDQLPERYLIELKDALEGGKARPPRPEEPSKFPYHPKGKLPRWVNFGRYSDYLGGRVFQELQRKPIDDLHRPEGDDRCDDVFFMDPTRRWRWHGQLEHARLWRHSFDYESDAEDPRFREHVWAMARVFSGEREADVLGDYPWMTACEAVHAVTD